MGRPEILAPAGDLERLKAAVIYGADAVYVGGPRFGLRAFAAFDLDELAEGVNFAHRRGVKVYVTVNIFAHNRDFDFLPEYLKQLNLLGVDAVIVSDPGVVQLCREVVPDLPIHLSTQAGVLNTRSALFWEKQGVKRVILAREVSLKDIHQIRKETKLELEVFVHGAMCVAYSGRCLLSTYFTGRSANRGECAQPCRWRYFLQEAKRPGEFLPIEEDDRGTYILSARDLCMIEHIPELVNAGVDGLKIEGRMKGVHYVATVTRAYRQALDCYLKDRTNYRFNPEWSAELEKVSHRPYSTGFYFGSAGQVEQKEENDAYVRRCTFIGLVLSYDSQRKIAKVEQRNNFGAGDLIEIIGPQTPLFQQRVEALYDENGESINVAPHPQQKIFFPVKRPVAPFDLVRRCPA